MDLAALSDRLRPLRLVWAAFLLSLVVFTVILAFAAEGSEPDSGLPLLLSGVAAAELGMIPFLRFQLLGPGMGLVVPNDLREPGLVEGAALERAARAAAARYFTGSIVGFAVTESIALLGFVSTFVTGDFRWYLAHAAFAALLLLIQAPRLSGVMSMLPGPERKGMRRAMEGWQ